MPTPYLANMGASVPMATLEPTPNHGYFYVSHIVYSVYNTNIFYLSSITLVYVCYTAHSSMEKRSHHMNTNTEREIERKRGERGVDIVEFKFFEAGAKRSVVYTSCQDRNSTTCTRLADRQTDEKC